MLRSSCLKSFVTKNIVGEQYYRPLRPHFGLKHPMPNGAKNWTITLNNYVTPCLEFDSEHMQYLICGEEVGKEGTPHLQGYVQFKKRKTLSKVKDFFVGAHLEIARGKPEQNVTYCSKDGKYHDHGVCSKGQGARNDLNDIKEIIDEGGTWNDIRDSHYSHSIRYRRALLEDIEDRKSHRTWATELHIHWGDTGTGKSRNCAESFPNAYWKTRGPWWDGYEGQEIVIIDEFYGWLPFSDFQRMCDRYPWSVPVKGGFRKFLAKQVHVTCNVPWTDWWPNIESSRVVKSIERRITSCKEYKLLK